MLPSISEAVTRKVPLLFIGLVLCYFYELLLIKKIKKKKKTQHKNSEFSLGIIAPHCEVSKKRQQHFTSAH